MVVRIDFHGALILRSNVPDLPDAEAMILRICLRADEASVLCLYIRIRILTEDTEHIELPSYAQLYFPFVLRQFLHRLQCIVQEIADNDTQIKL